MTNALILLDAIPDVQLIVSDVGMPGDQDGYALAKAVDDRFLECQVVLMSGFPKYHDQEANRPNVLRKPFTKNDLLVAIKRSKKSH